MKKRILSTLLCTTLILPVVAQTYQRTSQGVKTQLQGLNVEVSFYSPEIVRVVKYPETTPVLEKKSYSVIKAPEQTSLQITEETNEVVRIESGKLVVRLNTETGKVSYSRKDGTSLFTEKDYGTQFTYFNDAGTPSYEVRQAFMLDPEDVLYGLGQQQTGLMNQRNQKLFLRNINMKICIPIIHSVKGYAVFWDNPSPTTFTDNMQETSFSSEVGDCSDYYFMYGGNADGVIAQLRDLTGQAPLYPLWTLGFMQSRERYKSQAEILEMLHTYRRLKLPIDGVIQDWQYWGPNSNWNSMSFDNPDFPDPQGMVDEIHRNNARIMISVWASFGPDTEQFKIMKEKNMLYNFETWPMREGVRPYDPFNPEAREIYWKFLKKLYDYGIDAWWLDSTEPDHMDIKDEDFNTMTADGTFRRVHNAFPLVTNAGVYEHLRAEKDNQKRVFLLTRSSFAGQQRYGSHSWSGDVVSNWGVFRKQIAAGLNYTLCGIPYWNTDIGGFFAWEYGNDIRNKAYHELHTRWFEFGTFTPIMRSHNSGPVAVEVYQFGEKGDWAYDVQEKYLKIRYGLLPYIYSTSWQVTSQAGSFMRHLMMDFPEDKNVYEMDDEYLFGKSILVKAITEPMYVQSSGQNHSQFKEDFSTVKSTEVYLPKGADWYDFWTQQKVHGGQTVQKETPIDILPVYIRAGSILPWGPDVQYSTEKKWDNLELRVYPGANGEFTLYEDEFDNYNYEQGAYTTIPMTWDDSNRTLTIGSREGAYDGMLKNRKFRITCYGASKPITKSVSYNGSRVVVKL